MKIIRIFVLVISSFLFCGCPEVNEVDSTIYINNSSLDDIYFVGRGDANYYPWAPSENRLVLSNTVFPYKGPFKESLSNGSKIYIWLFDREIIDNTPWEEVVENEMYLTRYDLTLQDLEEMNWEIIFEGD